MSWHDGYPWKRVWSEDMVIAPHQRQLLPLYWVLSWPGGAGGTHECLEAKGHKQGRKTNRPLQPAHSSPAEMMPAGGLFAPETSK